MKYIGDLSHVDASLLARYACNARTVLEFGAGGSTQIIAQALPRRASFLSLETDPVWITTTRNNLRRLGVAHRCELLLYDDWAPVDTELFDLIFDDGVRHLRLDFALRSFPLLKVGGVLLLHDTRRLRDVRNVLSVVEMFFEEIEQVQMNERIDGTSSNITAVRKKAREPYVNWREAEGKPDWAYGSGVIPDEFWSE